MKIFRSSVQRGAGLGAIIAMSGGCAGWYNEAHPRTASVVGRRCRDVRTVARTSEAMFLLVRSLMPLHSPVLRSRQSSSFALPESAAISRCAREQPAKWSAGKSWMTRPGREAKAEFRIKSGATGCGTAFFMERQNLLYSSCVPIQVQTKV
jgi:hypothetical protein